MVATIADIYPHMNRIGGARVSVTAAPAAHAYAPHHIMMRLG